MGLTSKLNALGDAIRAKTGGTAKLTLDEMAQAIASIAGGLELQSDTLSQVNDTVAQYLEAAAYYSDENYASDTAVTDYADGENHDDPAGLTISVDKAGTLLVYDYDDPANSWQDSIAAGDQTIYNLMPGHSYLWLVEASGGITQGGTVNVNLGVRQIYCADTDNCRDLGGWGVTDGSYVRYGLLYRGMDASGHAIDGTLLDVLHVRQEVDLQEENSTNTGFSFATSAIGDGCVYYRFPFSAYYKDMVDLSGSVYTLTAECLTLIMQTACKGVPQYFHCSLGSDRTGTIAYLLLGLLGVSGGDCDKDYELTALTGSIWDASVTTRRRTIHPKEFRTYILSLGDGDWPSGCIAWAAKAGIDVDLLNAFRHAMTVGDAEDVVYPAEYTNQIPISTDTDGSVYGWKSGYRLNSSGTADGYSGLYLTGFIPVTAGDVVRLSGVQHRKGASTASNQRISFYSSSKTHLGQGNANYPPSSYVTGATYTTDNDLAQFTVAGSSTAYFRICGQYIGDDSIITVNEEIS